MSIGAIGKWITAALKPFQKVIKMLSGEDRMWTHPPGKPFINANGQVEMPEIEEFEKLTEKIRIQLKKPDLYPFASGVSSIAYASRQENDFVIKRIM